MAEQYAVDWSTPLIGSIQQGLALNSQKKAQEDKQDWDMYLTGVSLIKEGIDLPAEYSAQMTNVYNKRFGTTYDNMNFMAGTKKKDSTYISIDKFKTLVKNAQDVHGTNAFGTEQNLAKIISQNTNDKGFIDMSKKEAESLIENWYQNESEEEEFGYKKKKDAISQTRADFKEYSSLRKEFGSEIKNFKEISYNMTAMQAAMENMSESKSFVAIDQALINGLSKMLDPGSVVRESEYARTPEGIAMMDRIPASIEKLQAGGSGLGEPGRIAVYEMATQIYEKVQEFYTKKRAEYSQFASMQGLNPDLVIGDNYSIDEESLKLENIMRKKEKSIMTKETPAMMQLLGG